MSNHEEFHDERYAKLEESARQESVGRENFPGDAADGSDSPDDSAPEEEKGWFNRLADRLQPKETPQTRDAKSTEKTRGLVLLGLTAVGGIFLFFGLFTTDIDSSKKARPSGPSLGRPAQPQADADAANRSTVPQLSVNPAQGEESGELTEKDVLGTMRNRGTDQPMTKESGPRASRAAQELGQIDVDDPALADAYRRIGTAPPKRAVQATDWNKAIADHQASQQVHSKPAPAPSLAQTSPTNTADLLKKSSIVFVRSSTTVPPAAPVFRQDGSQSGHPLLSQGSVLVARLQHSVSSAAKVPIVAVIEYNYEQDGEVVVPAGSKAYGELSQATPQGWVNFKFHTLEWPDGRQEEITASALSMERGLLKGEVNGRNSGRKFLTRALTGVGTIAAYAVGGRGLGNGAAGIDSSVLLRERLASNIAMAGEQELALLAYQQNIVITVPANTRFFLVLHAQDSRQFAGARRTVTTDRMESRTSGLSQGRTQEALTGDEIRDLRQFRNEMRQMNRFLENSPASPAVPSPENQ
jgi:hypothetical protein